MSTIATSALAASLVLTLASGSAHAQATPDAALPGQPAPVTEAPPNAAPAKARLGRLHVVLFIQGHSGPLDGVAVQYQDDPPSLTNSEGAARLDVPEGKRCVRLSVPSNLVTGGAQHELCELLIVGDESTQVILTLDAAGQSVLSSDVLAPGEAQAARQAEEKFSEDMAEKPRGWVRGVVTSIDEKQPIAGARVFVRGVPVEATSDAAGRFELELPEGDYQLSVIHSKFSTLAQDGVAVKPEAETTLTLELSPSAAELDDFVVTAPFIAGGVASVMSERRKSASVTDALGSEDLAKSPDNSASSATRRIVGASIVGGQFLFVRGLGGRYSNVRLNGVPLPSTDPDLPGFQLDLFPASLLSSLTVVKTFSPEIPGDFAGGSLNVETRGFPEKLTLSASFGLTYNSETTAQNIPSYEGGGLDFLGMDDGTRALPDAVPDRAVINAEFDREERAAIGRGFSNTWQPGTTAALPNATLGFSIGDTLDLGAGQKLSYLATAGYRHSYTHYSQTVTRVASQGSGDETELVVRENLEREVGQRQAQTGALATVSYEPTQQHRLAAVTLLTQNGEDTTSLLSGLAENENARIEDTQLVFIERRLLFNQLLGAHEQVADLFSMRWQLNTARTIRDQPDTRRTLYAERPNGLSFESATGSGERLYSNLEQTDFGGGLDLIFPFSAEAALKAGYLGRTADREFAARRLGVSFIGMSEDLLLPPEQLLDPARSGELWLPDERTSVTDGFRADESLHAGYAMLELPIWGGLRAMGGVRLERFQQSIAIAPPIEVAGPPVAGADRTESDYLPAASLVAALSEQMNLRAAYGGTVARPQMRELAPFLTPDFARRRVVRGNPELERTFIQNFDLRWELFPTPTEVFAISLFYKSFSEPIESVVYDQLGNITYQNIERATNFGAELEARVGLGQVSDSLESFNAFANLALIRSQVTLTEEQAVLATSRERPLAGQSPFVANIAFGYEPEDNPFSAFVFYNVFGRRIQDVGTNGLPDVFEEPFHSLDVTAFYQLGDAWALSLSAGNLLLQDQRITQGGLNFSRTRPGSNVGLKLSWAP